MKTLLGKTVCFILRSHKWRRLRKSEGALPALGTVRICSRCGIRRAIKPRKAKAEA